MGSTWKKVKVALGFNMCLYGPRNLEDSLPSMAPRFSDGAAPSNLLSLPATPTSSNSLLQLSKSSTDPQRFVGFLGFAPFASFFVLCWCLSCSCTVAKLFLFLLFDF